MQIWNELFDGGTRSTQRKKKITFYFICATLALIAVMLIILAIFGAAKLISNASENAEANAQAPKVTIGATKAVTLDTEATISGDLLLLDESTRYVGDPATVIIRSHEGRAKTKTSSNVYSISSSGTGEKVDFRASAETVNAFNLMMSDFYAVAEDDNICITKAYTVATKDTVDAIYSAATALKLEYYFEFPGDIRSIYGVEKYDGIYANAYKYGFINVEDPSADEENGGSGVFRYVGIPHATYMRTKKLTLSAYLEQLKTATPDSPLLTKVGKVTYASYFLAADGEHLVPADYSYTVSGNSTSGYVVTAKILG